MELHPALIRKDLGNNLIGRIFILFDTVDSTNDICRKLGEGGFCEGTVVSAMEQRKGRGRKGRDWHSAPGKSLIFSILLTPGKRNEGLTILFSYSIVETLRRIGTDAMIKWPNDIYISGKKAGGILAEGNDRFVSIGAGLNINESEEDIAPQVKDLATSLRIERRECIDRRSILCGILEQFGNNYIEWKKTGLATFIDDIRRRLLYAGELVSVNNGQYNRTGRMAGISQEGYLLLETAGGVESLHSGNLSLERRGK